MRRSQYRHSSRDNPGLGRQVPRLMRSDHRSRDNRSSPLNPGSLILSGVMMLEHLGWQAAADLVVAGLEGAINAKTVTYDLERQMQGAKKLKTSEFGQAIVSHMQPKTPVAA